MSPRPGFVLEVDRSTPPTLMWHGEGFRLERLPVGTRVVYGPEPISPLADPDAAIRHALDHPLGDAAAARALLRPGMRLTIAFDDISLPLPPMRAPDVRQRVIEAVLDLAAAGGVDDVVLIAALALHRRMTDPSFATPSGTGSSRPSPRTACCSSTMPRTPPISSTSASPTTARTSRSTAAPPRATCSST